MGAVPAPVAAASGPPSLWRNRDFLLLWLGQVVSAVGTQVSQLAFPLLVLAVTGSPAQTGLLTALRGVPFLLLTLPGGALADRWDRKRVMILADTGRAIALGSIPVALALGHLSLVQLALASLAEGTLYTFFNVAEPAALPHVVAREQLPDAVALNGTIDSVSALLGPSLGGLLYSLARGLPFLTNAVTYSLSVLSLLFIKHRFGGERSQEEEHIWADIWEGLRYTWSRPVLRFMALLVGVLNLFSMGYPLIMIVRLQTMHAPSAAIGIVFATGGVGSIVGSLLVSPLQRRFTFGQVVIGSTWLWAITWLPYAFAPNVVSFGIANAVGWLVIPVLMGTQYSFRLATIPDPMQGRANAVIKLVAFGPQPLSLAVTGALIQAVGAVDAILIVSAPQFLAALAATLYRPLRATPRLLEMVRS